MVEEYMLHSEHISLQIEMKICFFFLSRAVSFRTEAT